MFCTTCVCPTEGHFLGPYPEVLQRIGAECGADRHIGRVAATGNQYATDARGIVARIKGVPAAAEIRLEPPSKIHGSVNWRYADITKITGAVTGGNIQAAAKSDGQVGIVSADT